MTDDDPKKATKEAMRKFRENLAKGHTPKKRVTPVETHTKPKLTLILGGYYLPKEGETLEEWLKRQPKGSVITKAE